MHIYRPASGRTPIKSWVPKDEYEANKALVEQTENLSALPFLHRHVALMPDAHPGYGMPIGGVLAAKQVIIPNAVGVDIGCGMGLVKTDVPAKELKDARSSSGEPLAKAFAEKLLAFIPVGFKSHQKPVVDVFGGDEYIWPLHKIEKAGRSGIADDILVDLDQYARSYGTLGGGNHFLELQEGNDGFVYIMVHSGSRSFGAAIANRYNQMAKHMNERYFSSVDPKTDLAFFPTDDPYAHEYVAFMHMALTFAKGSRDHMLDVAIAVLDEMVHASIGRNMKVLDRIDTHHNYAAIENHFDQNVWVHRKGAIRARKGEKGIIPGAMGSYSYIVEGLGNPESFCSAAHGAGRQMSRKKAREAFSQDQVLADSTSFYIAKPDLKDVAEEYKGAYKEIDVVMGRQADLVKTLMQLHTLAVMKG